MKEVTLAGLKSLTSTLSLINKIFIVLHKKTELEKEKFLNEFKKLASSNFKSAWKYIIEQADSFSDNQFDIVNPVILFQTYGIPPYIGEIDHGVMFCKEMVIGLKLKLGGNANISYRLDFDLKKRLHINFEIYDNKDKYPVCIRLDFSTGRYGFSQADKKSCLQDDDKMIAIMELTKVKFWLKMTIGNTLASMARQNQNNPKLNDTTLPNEQLLAFVQGKDDYSFDTVKNYVSSLLLPYGKKKISTCCTEQALLQCISEKPMIRSKVHHDIFGIFSKQDASSRLLSGLHHVYNVEQVDSDTKKDSEEPAKQAHCNLGLG